jgi:GH15 family glucan-1,4-alpha-glucosidase
LAHHVRLTSHYGLLKELEGAINTTIRYLSLTWKLPNYDCWEEHPEYLHPYSLACVYGGLNEIAKLIHEDHLPPYGIEIEAIARETREFLLRSGVIKGKIVKHILPPQGDEPARPVVHSAVDSSLLGMGFPFKVLDLMDPILVATVDEIETELHRQNGGVYRYKADVYYGGGEWILLTVWLGIHYFLIGQIEKATQILKWIEGKADPEGNLPEQISDHMLAPSHYDTWVKKWGPIASPLLWSHAMYLILYTMLQEKQYE